MGIEQTMNMKSIKNYGFEISKEIKDSRQKKDMGSRTMDLDLLKK